MLKLEKEGDRNLQDEIGRIRHAFTAAKDKFLKIPDALKDMPKLDPKGYKWCSFFISPSYSINYLIGIICTISEAVILFWRCRHICQ